MSGRCINAAPNADVGLHSSALQSRRPNWLRESSGFNQKRSVLFAWKLQFSFALRLLVFCCLRSFVCDAPERSDAVIRREEGERCALWSAGAHHKAVGKHGGARTRGCARLFAAVWFTGQSTGSQSRVGGQRSVAVVELPAFPGRIKAFPACLFTWQSWQTVNTKATVKTYRHGVIYALLRSRSYSDTAARNTWNWDAAAPGCHAYELCYT